MKNLIAPIILFLTGLGILIGLEVGAFAQVATLPPDPDAAGLISQLVGALGSGGYLVAALLGTALLVWVTAHYGPKLLPVLALPIPGALLALAMSMLVPVINTIAGGKLTVTEILGALTAGFSAWGGPAKLISLFTGNPVGPTAMAAAMGKPGVEL